MPSMEQLIQWEMFRQTMRQRRIALGLTQVDVDRRMDRAPDYTRSLESETRSIPTMVTLMMWTKALGGVISVDFPEEGQECESDEPSDVSSNGSDTSPEPAVEPTPVYTSGCTTVTCGPTTT